MSKTISRSTFLKGLAGCGAAALTGRVIFEWLHSDQHIPCRMLGPSMALGHMIRDKALGKVPDNLKPEESEITIVGGGIAGLSAAWWLQKQGVSKFKLLELESHVGGNSHSGKNQYSAYPWGAHYIPLANEESKYVRLLFEELGITRGCDASGKLTYNDEYLCHELQERLFKDGSFQEGLVPKRGLQQSDRDEIARFFEKMRAYREKIGYDGKPAFAIPLDLSSQDEDSTKLDNISMSQWLDANKFNSKPLRWYVNYCCRDDYGSTIDHVSAWAGIHYFAGRRGSASNAETNSVVTWPEGNDFIVNKLKERVAPQIQSDAMVAKIWQDKNSVFAAHFNPLTSKWSLTKSKYLICAAPRFVSRHIIEGYPQTTGANTLYAPWIVANISIKSIPASRGTSLAWDNVNYYSDSLGYVDASHQEITTRSKPLVITYYYPLSEQQPSPGRQKLFQTSAQQWCDYIVADLERMHPGIKTNIISIDLWPWGHGMIRPSVGFIWGEDRRLLQSPLGNIHFAHSDMSGISNFEEAQFQGVQAAQKVLSRVKAS